MKEHVAPSLRLFLALTVLLGLGYPAIVWGVGHLAFREAANGSLLRKGKTTVGSLLIGQAFSLPGHFHGRPSAAGDKGYDATSSGGTNLGPTSKKLADAVRDAVTLVREENPAAAGPVPADAVTSSASGLDPHVSPAYARWQAPRVAAATGIPTADLERMIAARTEGRLLGLFGEPRVNVLLLNLDMTERIESAAPAR